MLRRSIASWSPSSNPLLAASVFFLVALSLAWAATTSRTVGRNPTLPCRDKHDPCTPLGPSCSAIAITRQRSFPSCSPSFKLALELSLSNTCIRPRETDGVRASTLLPSLCNGNGARPSVSESSTAFHDKHHDDRPIRRPRIHIG